MSDHHVVMSNRMPSISYRYVAMSESPFLNAVSPLSGVVSPFGCKPPKYAIVVPALSLWRAATPPWNGTLYCTTPNRTTLQKALRHPFYHSWWFVIMWLPASIVKPWHLPHCIAPLHLWPRVTMTSRKSYTSTISSTTTHRPSMISPSRRRPRLFLSTTINTYTRVALHYKNSLSYQVLNSDYTALVCTFSGLHIPCLSF